MFANNSSTNTPRGGRFLSLLEEACQNNGVAPSIFFALPSFPLYIFVRSGIFQFFTPFLGSIANIFLKKSDFSVFGWTVDSAVCTVVCCHG